jgi:phage shock protein C
MKNRLYRNETNRVLGGVCSGLGEYLGIDPLFIRIFFILWTIMGELSVLIYAILWLVIPGKTESEAGGSFRADNLGERFHMLGREIGEIARQPSPQLITYTGAGLIGWGVYYLLRRFGFPWISWDYTLYFWPALLILAGIFVLIRATRQKK